MNRKERRANLNSKQDQQIAPPAVSDLIALAIQHSQAGRLEAAIHCLRRAVKIAPNLAIAHYNLGNALGEYGELKEAIFCFRKAIALAPNLPQAYSNLATALMQSDRFSEAEASSIQAVKISPNAPLAQFNLGTVFEAQRRLNDAANCYQKAIDLHPDFPAAHSNLAMVQLAQGDFEKGWREYEWRWKMPLKIDEYRAYDKPQWQGQDAEGKTLLIHSEQGLGDTIHFCRYGPIAAARGLRVIMQVQPPLARLLRGSIAVDNIIKMGEELPPFDFHCPLLSLPLAVGTTLNTVPAANSYLTADNTQRAVWHNRIMETGASGIRVGIVWAGNPREGIPEAAAIDRRRSIGLEKLYPVLAVPNATFFSLQKDHRAGRALPVIDLMSLVDDFADTAALIANLDLVISVDTVVAHLAAALGKEVWLLNRYDSCWRWLSGCSQSPWYPTMRIYNQAQRNDWTPVVDRIVADLNVLIKTRSNQAAMSI
jgi:Flp pilus assembly protein TadD